MIRNHDYRHYSTECVYIYSTTSHNSRINLMCCAISCADYGMVEFLTGKGMDISTSICCRNSNLSDSADSLPPLFCGLRGLLTLNDKAQETVDESKVLENIKNIVEDFAGNFTGTTPKNSHSTWTRYMKYAREREISQTTTVLEIIISSNDKINIPSDSYWSSWRSSSTFVISVCTFRCRTNYQTLIFFFQNRRWNTDCFIYSRRVLLPNSSAIMLMTCTESYANFVDVHVNMIGEIIITA